ncbi:TetR family transcriptional regulator [Nostocales cyanobacterium HT-58-2]|nr:TetR family transcriptional regulator [Nostocales cyanobacterium HT-58-2]
MTDHSPSPKDVSHSGRSRILDEAEALFRTRGGYNAVSMRDIACKVGIRQASLYYHFPSKEQLFVAVTERMFERHRTGLQQAIEQAGDDLKAQLDSVSGWFLSQPPMHFLSMIHMELPLLGEDNIKRLSVYSQECVFEPIRQLFAQAQERGEIRDDVRPKLLTGFFLSCIESVPYVRSFPDTASSKAIVNEVISVLLDGIKP